jgi:hypothetical protein
MVCLPLPPAADWFFQSLILPYLSWRQPHRKRDYRKGDMKSVIKRATSDEKRKLFFSTELSRIYFYASGEANHHDDQAPKEEEATTIPWLDHKSRCRDAYSPTTLFSGFHHGRYLDLYAPLSTESFLFDWKRHGSSSIAFIVCQRWSVVQPHATGASQ